MARLHRETWDFWRPRWIKSLPYLILLYALLWSSRVTSMCSPMPVVQLPSWCYLGRRSGTPRRLRPKLQRRHRWHYSNLPGWYVLLLTLTYVGLTAHVDTAIRARHLHTATQFTLTPNTRAHPIAGPDPMGSGTTANTSVERRPPQSRAQPPTPARPILPDTQCRISFTAPLGAPPGGHLPSTTVPLSTNDSSTACVGKSHFATCGLAPGDHGKIR